MKQELLNLLKEELQSIKKENEEHNKMIKRIKELQKNPDVIEYLKLINLLDGDLKEIKSSDKEIITSFYHHYLSKIEKEDTNNIYVYLGTYKNNDEIDVVHGSTDFRVNYNSKDANYRIYKNIEYPYVQSIPISMCDEFEKNHIVIKPKSYFKEREYYEIQKDFFTHAIKTNQESAKKMILKKYNK